MSPGSDTALDTESGPAGEAEAVRNAARGASLPPHLAARIEQMFPELTPAEIERLRRFGTVHTWPDSVSSVVSLPAFMACQRCLRCLSVSGRTGTARKSSIASST